MIGRFLLAGLVCWVLRCRPTSTPYGPEQMAAYRSKIVVLTVRCKGSIYEDCLRGCWLWPAADLNIYTLSFARGQSQAQHNLTTTAGTLSVFVCNPEE